MASEEMGVYLDSLYYWSQILNIDLELLLDLADEDRPASNNVDAWVKVKYAKQLKTPEVMAKLLGSKNNNGK